MCFVFRDSVRTVSNKRLSQKAQKWCEHLEASDVTRDMYRKSQHAARTVLREPEPACLPLAVVSYDYAKQLSVPMLSEQTMNEWFV